jgi:V-type H+-transporting ATPase subunit a
MVKDNYGITPPTYFKMTDFLFVFQTIVDTYGVPNYKEANPVPVSIISFPFFFGMMFGDLGHGSILLYFGLILVLLDGKLDKTPLGALRSARYFVFMMGVCATYCGLLYNEFFAMPTQIFDSCYNMKPEEWKSATGVNVGSYYPREGAPRECVYSMGLDYVWGLSNQKLNIQNNIKMKISVIYGVIHMSAGVIIKGTNQMMVKDIAGILWEVIGGLIILLGLFGWMDLLIFGKWFFSVGMFDDKTVV